MGRHEQGGGRAPARRRAHLRRGPGRTRAVTIHAPAVDVWPWIAQLGQGCGGFYSYDFLENLLGCDIHSSDRIVPEWQTTNVGDTVNLYPEVGLAVARVDPGRALVLRGPPPMGAMRAPCDFTWTFALHDGAGGTTRLVVRERYAYAHRYAALLVEPVEVISFVMSRRMLRGIRAHAQSRTHYRLACGNARMAPDDSALTVVDR